MERHLVVRCEVDELHNVDFASSRPVRSLCPETRPYLELESKGIQRKTPVETEVWNTYRTSKRNVNCIEHEDASYGEEVVRVDFDLMGHHLSKQEWL